jgi:hypothetical protein
MALLGFLFVSYQGCNSSYEGIVADRELLIAKNQEQISWTLAFVLVAVLFWNFIAILILRSAQHSKKDSSG